ncbi:Nitrilase/cyanide hydratase and apolipoprotein N-acyltransferase [Caballeronia temeraria]|uniref:Nitrilase/cyanide hydratase and apolipoprotein N-acyltransferase n=2 Tax=Caballeronia temeraria TaxID=1777137 RepID=A0A158DLJ7_9BURK|nr:Nitrilase/cyanide hydratase and apolipoprotein N-acyltransferase [Caballeronia temeraria]
MLLAVRMPLREPFEERMIWGQGDAAGLKVVETDVRRVGALAHAISFREIVLSY